MMNFILKLYIQNNLSNTFTCKNEFFIIYLFLYLILEFEYRKEKMKTQYITFQNQAKNYLNVINNSIR